MSDRDRDRDTAFLRRRAGWPVGTLNRSDLRTFHRLVHEGKARRSYDDALGFLGCARVARVVVGYGDGKKSPYGPTYADELRGDFA